MVTTKKMNGDKGEDIKRDIAFFGERVLWTTIRKKMDGYDKEDEWRQGRRYKTRHGIFCGMSAMDDNNKEDGW